MANVNSFHSASSVPTYEILASRTDEITGPKSVSAKIDVRSNFLSFIFRLPIEDLEIIFVYGALDYYNRQSGSPGLTPPTWVNVSYVCRHWRRVALNCPTLCTYLFITSPRWTEELLTRSKQVSLKLHVHMRSLNTKSRASRFLEQVVSYVERIQEFRIHLMSASNDRVFFSKLFSRFNGGTPALRTLELSKCPVSWYSLDLCRLTTLSLYDIPVQFQQDTVDFLATLRCMQDLTHLSLDGSLASATSFLPTVAFRTFQKVNLPHLSDLWIAAPLSTVIALLSCVSVPLKTEVKLKCVFEHGSSPDDYATLASLLARRFNSSYYGESSIPKVRSLVVRLWWGEATLTFNTSERDYGLSVVMPQMECCSDIPLQVAIHFGESTTSDYYSDRDRIISDICCAIPLTSIQSLHVIVPSSSSAFWRKILGHLQDLRHLKLSRGDMPIDVAFLLAPTPHRYLENRGIYGDRGLDQLLVPALEELELHEISFLQLQDGSGPLSEQFLYDALSSRTESRGKLTMVRCMVAGFRVAELDMVGEWEGGHFRVVEERRQPYHESGGFDWGSDSESSEDG